MDDKMNYAKALYFTILAFCLSLMNIFYLWTSTWRDRAAYSVIADFWNFIIHTSQLEYFLIHGTRMPTNQGNQVNIFVDQEILVLLSIVFVSTAIFYRRNGFKISVLNSVKMASLSLIPLGVMIYLLDRPDFHLHVTTWQAYNNFATWFTNEDLFIVSVALFLITAVAIELQK